MLPHLKSLAVFAKVAETLSFAGTAKVLNISAPVVSQHVSQLEEELGVALVYRSTRSLTLTEAGQKLALRAAQMLDAAETGLEELQTDLKEQHGSLMITAPSFLAAPAFTRLLLAFNEQHPNVLLNISYSTNIVNLIDSGFDLAIRVGELQDSNLKARKLVEGHGCIYASPEYLAKFPPLSRPEDVVEHGMRWILPPLSGEATISNLKTGENHQMDPKLAGFALDNGEAEKQMGLFGAGLVILPEIYILKELSEGKLVRVLPDWTTQQVGVFAVWPRNAGSRSLTRLFVDFLATNIKSFVNGLAN